MWSWGHAWQVGCSADLQDALHHLLIHVSQRKGCVEGDAPRLFLLEIDVGRLPAVPGLP